MTQYQQYTLATGDDRTSMLEFQFRIRNDTNTRISCQLELETINTNPTLNKLILAHLLSEVN